jgi:hypothetical protein
MWVYIDLGLVSYEMAMEREGERERREREREMCGKFRPKTEGRAFFCWVTLW